MMPETDFGILFIAGAHFFLQGFIAPGFFHMRSRARQRIRLDKYIMSGFDFIVKADILIPLLDTRCFLFIAILKFPHFQ